MMQEVLGASIASDERGVLHPTPDDLAAPLSSFTWRSRRVDDELTKRHRTEFVVLDLLGSGGFGKVYKVRNKLDSKCYALKVVPMPDTAVSEGTTPTSKFDDLSHSTHSGTNTENLSSASSLSLRRILREVEILSSIPSNDNVVRYYSAWVEETHDEDDLLSRDGEFEQSFPSYESSIYTDSYTSTRQSSDSGVVDKNHKRPVCHLCKLPYDDWEVGFEYWGLIDSVLQPLNLCIECYKESLPKHVDTSKMTIRKAKTSHRRLYILMEYCDSTLDNVIREVPKHDERHRQDETKDDQRPQNEGIDDALVSRRWSYFQQTVRGVAHLHANGIVHRDIKPNNIFLVEGIVKIGDLGLATIDTKLSITGNTLLEDGNNDDEVCCSANENIFIKQSAGVGTYLYRAPEIATGRYNEKCDVYSLGILLIEMFGNFETGMERAKVLGDLKARFSGPATMGKEKDDSQLPFHTRLAYRMIASDPKDRPSCTQILEEVQEFCRLRPHPFSSGARSTSSSSSVVNDSLLQQQQALLMEKDQEIARLQKLLSLHGIPYDKDQGPSINS